MTLFAVQNFTLQMLFVQFQRNREKKVRNKQSEVNDGLRGNESHINAENKLVKTSRK
jgi:hypothetical protein